MALDDCVLTARRRRWSARAEAANVLAEAQKIPRYLAQGNLANISFVDGAWR